MIYKYIAPHPALRAYARNYLLAHFIFDNGQEIPFKPYPPKPEHTITFLPNSSLVIVDPLTGNKWDAPGVSICGQQVSRYNFYLPATYLMLRVHFHPGVLHRLLQIPVSKFTNNWFDASSVIGSEVNAVNERLANCTTYGEMIDQVESYLTGKIKKARPDAHPLDLVACHIFENPTRFSLDWLANQACLSPRQFNRKFTERMGVGPKLYSRVVRFYKAYQYKETHPKEDWLSIALMFGYADYQHMVKDFKEFAHVTPTLWVNQDNQSPERLLKLE